MPKLRIYLPVLLVVLLYSCTSKTGNENSKVSPEIDSTELIKGPCAVIISPDTIEIDSLKKLLGEDDFYTIADDYVYYLADVQHLLDSAGIPVVATDRDTLKFLMRSGAIFQIPAKSDLALFPVYYFNGDEPPTFVEVMDDFRSPYKNVFRQ